MELLVSDFAKSFGIETNNMPEACIEDINKTDTNIFPIVGQELKDLILLILKKIEDDDQKVGADYRKEVWRKGWQENLERFKLQKSKSDLKPKFLRANQPIRWNQGYYNTSSSEFEKRWQEIVTKFLFCNYMKDCENIYEFGAGTGYNLLLASELFPNKNFFGSDFVQSAVDLINLVGKEKSINLKGHLFDMINPDYNYKIRENSAVMTFGAIEQLSGNVEKMFDYLLSQKIKLCVHVEPELDLYDKNVLEDYLAIKFQGKRGYSNVIGSYLKKLSQEKKIEILKIHRMNFGSLFMEGYNLFVWKKI
jgi:hypothetical protein